MTVNTIHRMIPKSKKAAIREIYEDKDGFWVILNEGWNADGMDFDCHVIHEGGDDCTDAETIEQLRYQISMIRKK